MDISPNLREAFINFLFFLAIVAGLLYLLGGLIKTIYWSNKSKTWPSAKGKVMQSEMRRQVRRGRVSYFTEVKYIYEVDGIQYEGDRITFDAIWGFETFAKQHSNRYNQGRKVPVYYNPNKPDMSTLEVESFPPITLYIFLVILSAFLLYILRISPKLLTDLLREMQIY